MNATSTVAVAKRSGRLPVQTARNRSEQMGSFLMRGLRYYLYRNPAGCR